MRRAILKGLLAHKLRLALTALAVVLGVAFVSGTLMFTDTLDRVFEQLFGESAKGVDAYVRSHSAFEGPTGPDRRPMPEAIQIGRASCRERVWTIV
jgi:putative ABC transport system permease protein